MGKEAKKKDRQRKDTKERDWKRNMQESGGKKGGIIRAMGTVLAGMGIIFMLAGLCLFLWNRREAAEAADNAAAVLMQMKDAIEQGAALVKNGGQGRGESGADGAEEEIPTVVIDGYEYAGYISIPALGLELPVMAQWSYPRLKIAPCIYYGSAAEKNLVIAAHNYSGHFGRLSKLEKGEEVLYADMSGTVRQYKVAAMEVLGPEAVEEMTDAGYELTLFTCTYGGASRVTLRCTEAE